MHFSIPDTTECTDSSGSSYTVFNVHINGVYHCSVRYRLFHSFHDELRREFGTVSLPPFPPKKFLSLSPNQLEERRLLLERYIQVISQNPEIAGCPVFNSFLLTAQQESQQEDPEDVTLDVFLMNGHKICVNLMSTDQTDDVLESVASNIDLGDDYVYYFGLYLIKKEEGQENSIVRKLQEFESPYISLKAAKRTGSHRIVLRKSFWDPTFDNDLMTDRVAMNLLFVQSVNDVERGWVMAKKEQHKQLSLLQEKGSKKEYLHLARTLKFYGFLQFKPCVTDYPHPDTRVIISTGNRELHFRLQISRDETREVAFKVTRMRCWRIATTILDSNGEVNGHATPTKLELSFEYLIAQDTLKWISVTSEQAILMSMCLQGMVDELIMKKEGRRVKRPADRTKPFKRSLLKSQMSQSSSRSPATSPVDDPTPNGGSPSHTSHPTVTKKLHNPPPRRQERSPGFPDLPVVGNDAFEHGIGDDDL